MFRFSHRAPFQRITHVTMDGSVIVNELRYHGTGTGYGVSSPYGPGAGMPYAPGAPYSASGVPYGASGAPYGSNSYPQVCLDLSI